MALFIVATPIGTLSDLSERAREVLAGADVVAAEDTRVTRKLLSALDIAAPPLESLNAHNEDKKAERLARQALEQTVVLVSDAGTPAVSDPGARVVQAALAMGVEVRSVPGPSALATALAASGFPAAPSSFLGFAPRKGRDNWARDLLARPETLVFYEAPGRVIDAVTRLAALSPTREAAICRELSKKFEEVRRGALSQLAEGEAVRGECVVVVGPGAPVVTEAEQLAEGASLKQIAAALATRWDVSKKEAYQRLLALERDLED